MKDNRFAFLLGFVLLVSCSGRMSSIVPTVDSKERLINFSRYEFQLDTDFLPSGITVIMSPERPYSGGLPRQGYFFLQAEIALAGRRYLIENAVVVYVHHIDPLTDQNLSELVWHEIVHHWWVTAEQVEGDLSSYVRSFRHLGTNDRPHERMADAAAEGLKRILILKKTGGRQIRDYQVSIKSAR